MNNIRLLKVDNYKIRKAFLENLPKWETGARKGCINWFQSVGYKVKFVYDGVEGEIKIVDYDGKDIYINYLDCDAFKIRTNGLRYCELSRLLNKYKNKFKFQIGTNLKENNRDLTITDREYKKDKRGRDWKWYKYKCNKCGWEDGWIRESQLLQDCGCTCCAGKIIVQGINDIPTTNPWMVKYFQGGCDEAKLYTKASSKIIYPICPDCGRIKDKPMKIITIYKNHSIGCVCGDSVSYPEKIIYSVLKQLNISFITQLNKANFEWCNDYRYDFYFKLNNKEYIVEADGEWHKINNNLSGQSAKKSQEIDSEKDKLANEHGIEVIRINCEKSELEFIKNNIINSELNNLFDLSNINWDECEEFALSNLVKKVCDLWNSNSNVTTTDIEKIINLSKSTIIIYLKKGSKLGWCHYNAKEELRKNGIRNGKKIGKSVEIFKDGESFGVFESATELARQSKKLFGIKLTQSRISYVCIGKDKIHKGFTFKYLSNGI